MPAQAKPPRRTFQPLNAFPAEARRAIRLIFTDIDDTLTSDGRLTARAYESLERLQGAGIRVVPITGRPAGWCDHIARMWPVDAVVGENGAFYFHYDRAKRKMRRRFDQPDAVRAENRARLIAVRDRILAEVPGCAVASDQAFRETDLAIDFCEDVPALPDSKIVRIVELFEAAGATAKISSIHVNGWFGTFDKLTMARRLAAEVFDLRPLRDLAQVQKAFDEWRPVYNTERPHQALDMTVPAKRYRPSPRTMPKTLPEPHYGPEDIVRRVGTTKFYVSFKGRLWVVPKAFAGERVAIRPRGEDGQYGIFFGATRIADIDLRT